MIFPNSVQWSLFTTIASDSTVVNSGITVDINQFLNTDPNRMPWVGVYISNVSIEPGRINTTNPWMTNYELKIYVQAGSNVDGTEANDLKDRAVSTVMTAINGNRKLDSTVCRITGFTIVPFERNLDHDDWVFTDEITLTAETFS